MDGPKSYKLPDLCEYFHVPFHAARAHDALGDVTATLGLLRAMRAGNAHKDLAAEVGQ